jgi:hypothetical protein
VALPRAVVTRRPDVQARRAVSTEGSTTVVERRRVETSYGTGRMSGTRRGIDAAPIHGAFCVLVQMTRSDGAKEAQSKPFANPVTLIRIET